MPKKRKAPQFQAVNQKSHKRSHMIWAAIALVVAAIAAATMVFWPKVHQTVVQTTAKTEQPVKLSVDAKSALVVDLTTGQILGEKNADKQVAIASQSKMLVAYGVLKAIDEKKIKWTDQVTIPSSADLSSQNNSLYSHLSIKAGDKVSVKDLYWAMFTNSANDAAFALVTYLSGDQSKDQATLQALAKDLKLTGSEWYNGAGQKNGDAFANEIDSASSSAYNHASASQVAMIARKIVDMDPSLLTLTNSANLTYTKNNAKVTQASDFGSSFANMQANLDNPKNLQLIGLKTGSTPESGASYTGIVKDQDGHLFLTVINGAADYTDKTERFQKTVDMVGQVLDDWQAHDYKAGTTLSGVSTLAIKDEKVRAKVQVAKLTTFWTKSKKTLKLMESPTLQQRPAGTETDTIAHIAVNFKAKYLSGTSESQKEIPLELAGQPTDNE
ncbi:D-alanyl-D-alanine carboxypeptidase family protein [Fructobacillus parabroussonetiae]|uniref:D-alanyl-D-alanine carboxypeptidase n=1 Tax=Fructobacillus parabroussonetiae TaxID=2713174 RepID=A0ABS5QY04_9LACO|nr:serine hydrolase [Fructobacillus parabroussonetiae]MBS9337991.1 D-alanyl-D-alanine carboxypeptidase [Fructobacillus parabroussonetiae]